MKKTLDISITVTPKTITAIDKTDYSSIGMDINEHVMVDFLSYGDEGVHNIAIVSEWNEGEVPYAELPIGYDGLLYYYKLAIPKLEHFMIDGLYEGVEGQLFMYNNILYVCNKNDSPQYIDNILSNSKIITNYVEAYDMVLSNVGSQTFYGVRQKVLIYVKLQECLVKLQKELLLGTKGCSFSGGKCNDSSLKGKADFLLVALYILEYLKNIGNYEEALRILENLASCPDLCSGLTLKGCGCGKTI